MKGIEPLFRTRWNAAPLPGPPQQALETVLGLDIGLDDEDRFRLSEKLRAWEWRQDSPLDSAVPTPGELAELLPEEVAVVHFTVLADRLETWWIEPGSARRHTQALDRSKLKRRIERLEWALDPRSHESELYDHLDGLYQLLIQPLPVVDSERLLIFIPDGTLSSVPFPALHDATKGQFLIEKHPVAVAPAMLLVPPDHKRPTSRPALLIAADSPSPSLDLPKLPWAAQGLHEIATLHPAAEVMINPTAGELLPRLDGRPLVHFAGHAQVHPTRPELTRLALAGDTESDAVVTLAQAVDAGLADAELVTLSACRTMDHAFEDRDVTLGAAGFLVGRGVESVLASGQDVSDPLAAWLMPGFYAARANAPNAPEALRRVVLELLSSGPEELRSPAYWGIFSIVRAIPTQQPRRTR